MRGRARRDKNQKPIIEALREAGTFVIDLSGVGHGVPDLVVWTVKGWQVAEIKNPENAYGRKGLTKRQKEWSTKSRGGPTYVIRSIDEALSLMFGEVEKLESFGGYNHAIHDDIHGKPIPT